MKFKIIFLVFNGIILVSFLFIFLLPVFFLGWDFSQMFWASNWPLAALFVAIMAGLNLYFGLNWKLFSYLEAEDWNALIAYLEEKVYTKKQLKKQRVRILINAYIVVSAPAKIETLELFLREHKPEYVPQFAVQFGVPRLLKNDPVEMEAYYGEMRQNPKCRNRAWIDWSYAFALMLQQRSGEAKELLLATRREAKSSVLELLSLYLLDAYAPSDTEAHATVQEGRRAFRQNFTRARWEKELEKQRGNLEVLVLSKLIKDAGDWAFADTVQNA